MSSDPNALERLSRDELIAQARQLGAKRPELLTRPELRDEIIRLSSDDEDERRRARGWFGVARDLVASVVGQGLNLPDTADLIRGNYVFSPKAAPPVATVTLAEIYAAQGHVKKAVDLLDEVLQSEPDHEAARQARERLTTAMYGGSESATPVVTAAPEPEAEELGDSEVSTARAEMPAPRLEDAVASESTRDDGSLASDAAAATTAEHSKVEELAAFAAENDELPFPEGQRRSLPTTDRAFLLRRDGAAALCSWEVTAATLARMTTTHPDGALVLRVVEVAPSWDGPLVEQRDIAIEPGASHTEIVTRGGGTELRVVLGWLTERQFVVVAVAAEFGWSETGEATLNWAPPATMSGESWVRLGGAVLSRIADATSAR